MNSIASMLASTLKAKEDSIINRCPFRIGGFTVKTKFVFWRKVELIEYLIPFFIGGVICH